MDNLNDVKLCDHLGTQKYHRRERVEVFWACNKCADIEFGHPEYYETCPHCGARIGVN